MEVFTNPSMPFYKFGDLFFLEKIERENWIEFITSRFKETGKYISMGNAALIAEYSECHPYYVQQVAQQAWLRTQKECTKEIVDESLQNIVLQLSLLFQTKTDELTNPQLNFLRALLDGVEKFSSTKTLHDYKLGSSSNVVRIKQALENKEIIDVRTGKISLLDPMYKNWLSNYYFNR